MIGALLFWGWVAFATLGIAASIVWAVRMTRRGDAEAVLEVEVRR